jgi:hypothetical protein
MFAHQLIAAAQKEKSTSREEKGFADYPVASPFRRAKTRVFTRSALIIGRVANTRSYRGSVFFSFFFLFFFFFFFLSSRSTR